ncbi:GIN domain-containing protein [Undibacterium sp.]|uniref:GIN domain-containing protein n=1 Tax=Undibacterium sp. TaxID=1914977 RepID=UPI00374DBA01
MKKSLLLAPLAALLSLPVLAASTNPAVPAIAGSGTVTTQQRSLAPFNALALDLPDNVELKVDGGNSVSVETDDNLQPLIETSVAGKVLTIRRTAQGACMAPTRMKLVIHASALGAVTVGSTGKLVSGGLSIGSGPKAGSSPVPNCAG